ncbi:secretion protein HlyD [Aeromonas media]|uniref:copper-binding protein n=1 Tax=Aeromonas media TaxID=651 RepID=UPI0011163F0B|nr:copper-binding protein [Aeromonas media]TNI61990.1 secretion protein HlyD [Aeromonas media]
MNYKTLTLTLLLGLGAMQAQAEMTMNHEGHDMYQMEGMVMAEAGDVTMTRGIITRIDGQNGKVGIKHEAIANLNMPPMTMVFVLADPAQLQGMQVGDVVRFHAENPAGKLTLTRLQKL